MPSKEIKNIYSFLYAHQDNEHNIEAINKLIDSLTVLVKENENLKKSKDKFRDEYYSAEAVLTMLVELKDHKDKHGKDGKYLKYQPIAWQNARKLLKGNK